MRKFFFSIVKIWRNFYTNEFRNYSKIGKLISKKILNGVPTHRGRNLKVGELKS